jgi:hypothetical protein
VVLESRGKGGIGLGVVDRGVVHYCG